MPRAESDIQADLDAAYAARRKAMLAASSSDGDITITRQALQTLNQTIQSLVTELNQAVNADNGRAGITMTPVIRGW